MLCVSIRGPTFEEAYDQITRALAVADVVELRLDLITFGVIDLGVVSQLRSAFSIPMIFTVRKKDLLFLDSLLQIGPEYLDVEATASVGYLREISRKWPDIKIILSYHDYTGTPDNFDEIYQMMANRPAHLYKVAVTAHSTNDALRLMCWAKRHDPKIIAISMGPYGSISRIASRLIGSPITYASIADSEETAPGQIAGEVLMQQYRFRTTTPNTALYGLIGDPVERSVGGVIHNQFCLNFGIDALYVKMQVTPEELPQFLDLAKQIPFAGLSVTMPLKEAILPYLDEIDSQACDIGAVNTLCFQEGKIRGYNTDAVGALQVIERVAEVRGKKIVVIGAGGAAKAVIYEALKRGAHVTIVGRNEEKIQKVAERFRCSFARLDRIGVERGYDILVNCTPVSMPIAADAIISGSIVMDCTTSPVETPFLRAALERKCQIIYGYQMFVEQAVCQWAIWRMDQVVCGEGNEFIC